MEELLNVIIAELRQQSALTERANGTTGYGLANLWEEFKYLFQRYDSYNQDGYDHIVWPLCRSSVQARSFEWQVLAWLQTIEFEDVYMHMDVVNLTDYDESGIAQLVYDQLIYIASNEPLIANPDDDRHDEYIPGG